MAFQSNEGKTSGVCRDCNQLPDPHGVCGCKRAWDELGASINAKVAAASHDHPKHENTLKDYCIECRREN